MCIALTFLHFSQKNKSRRYFFDILFFKWLTVCFFCYTDLSWFFCKNIMLRNGQENHNYVMTCFCFFLRKTYHDFILIIKKIWEQTKVYEFYISDGRVNSIVWEQCGTYLTSTVIPLYVTHLHQKEMIQINSIVWNLCVWKCVPL